MAVKAVSEYKGKKVISVWHESKELEDLSPVTQVYGFCFTPEGKLLLIGEHEDWNIPGGKPKEDENPKETLKREVWEEARIKVKDLKPIGYCEVKEGKKEVYYQLRYFAIIDRINEVRPDPTTGKTYKREFIDPEKFIKWTGKWGGILEAMIEVAKRKFREWEKENDR